MINTTKQPKALSVFFLTEMWERYGFTMLEIVLVLYLIKVFFVSDDLSYGVMGSVTALAYVNSVVGGFLADRYIGHRRAVLLGAILLSCAYAALAAVEHLWAVYFALALLTLGTGLLKPNISSLVGTLYTENDPRRHSGFTIFYIGINVGNMLTLFLSGYIQQYFGWHTAYFTAMVMLIVAFITFWIGVRYFKIQDVQKVKHGKREWLKTIVALVVMLAFNEFIIKHQQAALIAFVGIAVASAAIVIYEAFHEKGKARSRIFAYLVLVAISVVYWALFFQIFMSINLFIDRAVDHKVFGFTLATSSFAAVESVGVILFGLVLSKLWTGLGTSRWSPSTPMKFSLGLFFQTLAFGVVFLSYIHLEANGLIMGAWIVLLYFVVSIGELLLSPTGLAMVTELVPKRLAGVMMGIFFISLGLGGKLAGVIADQAAIPDGMTNVSQIQAVYHHAFVVYFTLSLVAALISLALVPVLKKLIQSPEA